MIRRGTRVANKTELANLLDTWFRETTEPTVGDVGSYGGRAWIIIDLAGDRAQLNADTTRRAVRAYLDDVAKRGAEVPWRVVTNRDGRINKGHIQTGRERCDGLVLLPHLGNLGVPRRLTR